MFAIIATSTSRTYYILQLSRLHFLDMLHIAFSFFLGMLPFLLKISQIKLQRAFITSQFTKNLKIDIFKHYLLQPYHGYCTLISLYHFIISRLQQDLIKLLTMNFDLYTSESFRLLTSTHHD